MAWESRGRRRYYYRTEWADGRAVKRYVGRGRAGELAGLVDDEARTARHAAALALRAERDRLAGPEAAAAALGRLARLLADAALYAAGYHRQNHSAWRRRRGTGRRGT